MTNFAEHRELLSGTAPWKNYPGGGEVWFVDSGKGYDGCFTDWAVGRAVAEVMTAFIGGHLVMKDGALLATVTEALEQHDEKMARLQAEVDAWRGCVQINAQMKGPKLMGVSRSELQRVFNKYWEIQE